MRKEKVVPQSESQLTVRDEPTGNRVTLDAAGTSTRDDAQQSSNDEVDADDADDDDGHHEGVAEAGDVRRIDKVVVHEDEEQPAPIRNQADLERYFFIPDLGKMLSFLFRRKSRDF